MCHPLPPWPSAPMAASWPQPPKRYASPAAAIISDCIVALTPFHACVQGTLIRVFSLPAGTRQYVFRRGSSSASISCLSFSQDGHFLVAAGSTQTIHVYKLGDAPTAGSRSSSMDAGTNRASLCQPFFQLTTANHDTTTTNLADDSSAKPSAMASVVSVRLSKQWYTDWISLMD